MELIVEFILEIFGYAITESKLKTWIKTVLFLVVSQGVTAVLVLASVEALKEGYNGGWIVVIIAVLWFIFSVTSTVSCHRRHWKQTDR